MARRRFQVEGKPAALPIDSQITFCYTDNLTITDRFYLEVMGFPLAIDQGNCHIYRVTASSFIGFCQRNAVGINHDNLILTLVSDEVDRWYERLKAGGATVVEPPKLNERTGIYHFFARDPNGYRLEIQRFVAPDQRVVAQPAGGPA
jgi:predicted enzyme related to lactoylglutathione lyase